MKKPKKHGGKAGALTRAWIERGTTAAAPKQEALAAKRARKDALLHGRSSVLPGTNKVNKEVPQ